MRKRLALILILVITLTVTTVFAAPGDTTRVSVDSSGAQGNNASGDPSISADGRHVAFVSAATNLASGDMNGFNDVFVRDIDGITTTLVSVDSSGAQGNGASSEPSISADGRYVAFKSDAANLVGGDTNGLSDIFVRDLNLNTTTRISVDSSGAQGNNASDKPFISADGRYVTFRSFATNLVGGDTNVGPDVFVRDLTLNTTTRVSVDSSGAQGNGGSDTPSISTDGRYVTFRSVATNLVGGDTNGQADIFVRDTVGNKTTRASVASDGTQGNAGSSCASISADGRYVVFYTDSTNLVSGDTNGANDVFLRDRITNTTTRVSVDSNGAEGNSTSVRPVISANGRYVAFDSVASNLVSGDTNGMWDAFVRDTVRNTTTRVSVDSSGAQGNDISYFSFFTPSISADGRYVVFYSNSSNLVSGDTNGLFDVFVHEQDIAAPTVASQTLQSTYTGTGPSSFTVTFSEKVNNAGGGALTDDAANPDNYVVMEQGKVSGFQTSACNAVDALNDTRVTPSGVTYIPNTAVVNFGSPLPVGLYRLFVCGTTSIVDLAGNHLNNGTDSTFDFTVSTATASRSSSKSGNGNGERWLPNTGFAPNVVTRLPEHPDEQMYAKMGDLWLEIPSQKIKANIVGVPQSENNWDVKWLGNDAGWLNGTAFPSWEGNSVLTGHVMGADGLPGPFAKLQDLGYGERVIVHMLDQQYVFEVRNKRLVRPDSTSFAFEHLEGDSYLTLVTCSGYNEEGDTYSFRRIIRAVLVEVK